MSASMNWLDADKQKPDDGETVIIHTLGGEVWTGFLDGDVKDHANKSSLHSL
jgi:hypothetical protein